VWKYEQRDGGKPTKVPYEVNGSRASSTDPRHGALLTWQLKTWQRDDPPRWSGIGSVFFCHDPFFGIDLDHCLDADGRLKPWAQPIMERFSRQLCRDLPKWEAGSKSGQGESCRAGHRVSLGGWPRRDLRSSALLYRDGANNWPGQMLDVESTRFSRMVACALAPRPEESPFTLDDGKIPKGTQHDTWVSIAGTNARSGM